MPSDVNFSDSQVKKAGSTLRKFLRGEDIEWERVEAAYEIAQAFRAAHQRPLGKVNMGLRSMVVTARCDNVEVSQRMKRWATILDKLQREPQLALNRMQDIGGCRAVLSSIDEVRRVEARIRKNRPEASFVDYIDSPRSSGYRGVHAIVRYDSRQIEIQLRTQVMHDWAIAMERLSSRIGTNLKGDGDHAVQAWMAAIAEAMAMEEVGEVVPDTLHSLIQQRRLEAEPHLRGMP